MPLLIDSFGKPSIKKTDCGNFSQWVALVAPANLFLFELYHESGTLQFEEYHPGSQQPHSGKSNLS